VGVFVHHLRGRSRDAGGRAPVWVQLHRVLTLLRQVRGAIDQLPYYARTAHVRWSFDPEPTVPGNVRQRLAPVLAGWGLTSDHTDDALLVINELLTNAVEHARTPLILTVSFRGTALLVEVRDESVAEPQLQPVDLQAARGRGLQFVDALARRWSWTADASGKTVWAEIPSVRAAHRGRRSVQPSGY
jgi:anti-sigma regulatory factor (Ser/Thr protein kinase)